MNRLALIANRLYADYFLYTPEMRRMIQHFRRVTRGGEKYLTPGHSAPKAKPEGEEG